MKYFKLAVNKYQLLILPPILISFALDYKSNSRSNWDLYSLFSINVFLLLSFAIILRKINNLRKFEPLKIILKDSKIETTEPDYKLITLAIILSGLLIASIFLGLYLSVRTNINLFTVGIIAVVFAFLAFLPKINLFNKVFGSIYTGIFLGGGIFYAAHFLSFSNLDFESASYFSILSILAFLPSGIEDLQRINTDFKEDKKTLASVLGEKKYRLVIIALLFLIYILHIVLVIKTGNIWHFIPLFSGTIAANLGLKIYSRYGAELNSVVYLGFGYYFFHTILMLITIFSI